MQRIKQLRVWPNGFSLAELLIVLVILGVLTSISVVYVSDIWKGQIVISNLENIRSWLEGVRRASLRGQACTITLSMTSLRDGSKILESEATSGTSSIISSTPCGSPTTLALASPYQNQRYLLNFFDSTAPGTTISQFTMTPRGTLFKSDTDKSFTGDLIFSLRLANSSFVATSKPYCLRMSGFLGSVQGIGVGSC